MATSCRTTCCRHWPLAIEPPSARLPRVFATRRRSSHASERLCWGSVRGSSRLSRRGGLAADSRWRRSAAALIANALVRSSVLSAGAAASRPEVRVRLGPPPQRVFSFGSARPPNSFRFVWFLRSISSPARSARARLPAGRLWGKKGACRDRPADRAYDRARRRDAVDPLYVCAPDDRARVAHRRSAIAAPAVLSRSTRPNTWGPAAADRRAAPLGRRAPGSRSCYAIAPAPRRRESRGRRPTRSRWPRESSRSEAFTLMLRRRDTPRRLTRGRRRSRYRLARTIFYSGDERRVRQRNGVELGMIARCCFTRSHSAPIHGSRRSAQPTPRSRYRTAKIAGGTRTTGALLDSYCWVWRRRPHGFGCSLHPGRCRSHGGCVVANDVPNRNPDPIAFPLIDRARSVFAARERSAQGCGVAEVLERAWDRAAARAAAPRDGHVYWFVRRGRSTAFAMEAFAR